MIYAALIASLLFVCVVVALEERRRSMIKKQSAGRPSIEAKPARCMRCGWEGRLADARSCVQGRCDTHIKTEEKEVMQIETGLDSDGRPVARRSSSSEEEREVLRLLQELEDSVKKRAADDAVTLTCIGSLRVAADKVFVGRRDGRRALSILKQEAKRRHSDNRTPLDPAILIVEGLVDDLDCDAWLTSTSRRAGMSGTTQEQENLLRIGFLAGARHRRSESHASIDD